MFHKRTTTYRRRTTTTRARPYKRRARATAKPKATFVKRVKAIVNRQAETKETGFTVAANNISLLSNSAANYIPDVNLFCLTPAYTPVGAVTPFANVYTIPPGTGNGNRIGEKINVLSLTLKGYISFEQVAVPNTTNSNPMIVKMFIGRMKNGIQPPLAADTNVMYKLGDNNFAPTATLIDLNRPINTKLWEIYQTRVFKLGPQNPGISTALAPTLVSAYLSNNDFKLTRFFRVQLNKHVKTLVWQAVVGVPQGPTNQAIYMWFEAGNFDGTVVAGSVANATDATKVPLVLSYDIEMKYKDF